MKKSELVDKINEIFSKIEELTPLADELNDGLKRVKNSLGELPIEANEIEEDEKEEGD